MQDLKIALIQAKRVWPPGGAVHRYDKKRLFRYPGEQEVYTPGDGHLLVAGRGWRVRPFICDDLLFSIWTRNLDNVYDAAIFVASWPERRALHWSVAWVSAFLKGPAPTGRDTGPACRSDRWFETSIR